MWYRCIHSSCVFQPESDFSLGRLESNCLHKMRNCPKIGGNRDVLMSKEYDRSGLEEAVGDVTTRRIIFVDLHSRRR